MIICTMYKYVIIIVLPSIETENDWRKSDGISYMDNLHRELYGVVLALSLALKWMDWYWLYKLASIDVKKLGGKRKTNKGKLMEPLGMDSPIILTVFYGLLTFRIFGGNHWRKYRIELFFEMNLELQSQLQSFRNEIILDDYN